MQVARASVSCVAIHTDGAFLFPQMTLDQQAKREMGEQCWSPGFVDYLFLVHPTTATVLTTEKPVAKHCALILVVLAFEDLDLKAQENYEIRVYGSDCI